MDLEEETKQFILDNHSSVTTWSMVIGLFKHLKSFHVEEKVIFTLYNYRDQNGQYKLG